MASKIWLITGASKGFGRVWTTAALERGDNVIATARNLKDIEDLTEKYNHSIFPVQLDVNGRRACFDAVKQGADYFGGKIDILISNAGYGQFGAVEELNEDEARGQMETNFFGSLWMIQAVLPYMRQQKSGRILQVSSIAGIAAFPNLGIYHASKWAVEGLCETLSQEVERFGIKVTLIEPGGYATEWGTASAKHSKSMLQYDAMREERRSSSGKMEKGDPNATAAAILKLVDSDEPPLRLFLGKNNYRMAEQLYKKRLDTWRAWQEVSEKAQGELELAKR
jgi:NAD(P)-dependent dehydrogenase (short-subunit alcohol dehydrogenase family)